MLKNGVTSCPHAFHYACIKQWSSVTNSCPLCHEDFDTLKKQDGAIEPVEAKAQPNHLDDVTYWGQGDPVLDDVVRTRPTPDADLDPKTPNTQPIAIVP